MLQKSNSYVTLLLGYIIVLLLPKELLMSGLPEIDPDDWQANTEYSGDVYDEDHPVIKVITLTVLLGLL